MPEPVSVQCLNCHKPLAEEDVFCRYCGQKTSTKRLKTPDLLEQALQKFVQADFGILRLTRDLATRPGQVVREYIEGQRKRYYPPLSYLTISTAIAVFLSEYFHLLEYNYGHQNPGSELATRYLNLIILIGVPVSAFFSWLLFRKNKFNYAENLVFHAFLGGFRTVFFVLVFTPLVLAYRQHYFPILTAYLLIWVGYVSWAMVRFFGGPVWLAVLMSFLTLLGNQIVITLLITIAVILTRSW